MKPTPLSVLMVLDSMDAGGTETHVISLIKSLTQSGQQVSLVSAEGNLRRQFEAAGCSIFLFDYQSTNSAKRAECIAELQDIMLRQHIDCIHAHQTPSGLLAAAAADELGIPIVFTAHGTYYPREVLKTILNRAHTVISVSTPVQAYIRKLGFPSQVIPNGIDLTEFHPTTGFDLRSEWGLSKDSVILLYASRLAWGKATICDILLRTMKDLHRYGWNQLHLAVIGDGPKYEEMKALAHFIHQESGQTFIHLLGRQTNMHDYYNAADIVIGTGRVALEALACEKPVLAIGNHGYFGWIEPGNYEQAWSHYFGDHGSFASYSRYLFANEIAKGCRSPELLLEHGREGRRWVESDFNIDQTAAQVLNVYRSAVNKPR